MQELPRVKLYGYWRSSAAYRVRIALNLKAIDYVQTSIHLVKDGGQHRTAEFEAINPQKLVPALELEDGSILTQSVAILEYLEETYPSPPLLPSNPRQRAATRALVQLVASDIHPIDNLRVLKYLSEKLEISDEEKMNWYHHWILEGFGAYEAHLSCTKSLYSVGDTISMADICLIPQLYNARRFSVPLGAFSKLLEIEKRCLESEAFRLAVPEVQVDATS